MAPHVDTPQSLCRFGIAVGDITPPVGIYHRMWGAAVHDRAEGVHRPLTATAMVFQPLDPAPSPAAQQWLIALDHCLLGSEEAALLLSAVSKATGLERESTLLVFSHTHAAGLMSLDRQSLPGGDLIPAYLQQLAARVAELAVAARDRLQPVAIAYAKGRCSLAANRDFWDEASGQYVCGFNPLVDADDTVLLARVTNAEGRLAATVVNYACHATTLAWDNRLVSPDFPGAMREVVERASRAPCVFLQGASGDLGPREGFVGDTATADRNGRQLGYAALAALESLPPPNTRFQYAGPVVSGATIGTWSHVPVPPERRRELASWRLKRWFLPLSYRTGLPSRQQVAAERERRLSEEEAARAAGDEQRARDCRAMVERATRLLSRLDSLPPGDSFPYQIALWRMGDAVWLAVQGEPYNLLQRSPAAAFPQNTDCRRLSGRPMGTILSALDPVVWQGPLSGLHRRVGARAPGTSDRRCWPRNRRHAAALRLMTRRKPRWGKRS